MADGDPEQGAAPAKATLSLANRAAAARRKTGWTVARRKMFLAHLAATGCVRLAVRKAKMTESGVYALRLRDAGFRAAWAEALREGYAKLEAELLDRALNGTRRTVFHAGKAVAEVTEFSDKLALILLARHRDAVVAATPAAEPDDEEAVLRARLEARFAEMERRMANQDLAPAAPAGGGDL